MPLQPTLICKPWNARLRWTELGAEPGGVSIYPGDGHEMVCDDVAPGRGNKYFGFAGFAGRLRNPRGSDPDRPRPAEAGALVCGYQSDQVYDQPT
jgi:hypothetical protein